MTRMLKHKIKSFLGAQGVSASLAPSQERLEGAIARLQPRIPEGLELIRIGGKNDGGYMVPDDFDGVIGCLSPGVDYIASFESDLKQRGIGSHLIDFSVDGPPDNFEPASFTKKFLGASSGGNQITLGDWMSDIGLMSAPGDLILQIDIEGAEYEVLLEAPAEILDRFRVIVLELHHLESLSHQVFLRIFEAFAKKLTRNHQVVHVHPNNVVPALLIRGIEVPPVIELTLIRCDRIAKGARMVAPTLPHPLDCPNVPSNPDHPISKHWMGI
ncbi:MAG: FkbM family methyltransferase [Parasphingorhabdus sp.]